MSNPAVLQVAPCPERDDIPIAAAFRGRPAFDTRPLETKNLPLQADCSSGSIETGKAAGGSLHDNLQTHLAGHPLPTPTL